MPAYIPCADTRCQKSADSPGKLCADCEAKAKREQEQYERLTQKDSRNQKNKKGWKK